MRVVAAKEEDMKTRNFRRERGKGEKKEMPVLTGKILPPRS